MAVEPHEFLDVAKLLPEEREIQWRTAINRAYYAAHQACLIYQPDDSKKGGKHERLIEKLLNSADEQDIAIGGLLRDLKFLRVKADYKLHLDINRGEKEKAILKAEYLLKKLNALK